MLNVALAPDTMGDASRYCPLCDAMIADVLCPIHRVPTIVGLGSSDLSEELLIGRTFGERYAVERLISKGGMGAVFRANQVGMNRPIALKILHRDLMTDPSAVRRFYREAQAVAKLKHPHIVPVIDFGIDDDSRLPYLAMEFLEGLTLRSLIERGGPLSEIRSAHLLGQVAKGLIAAHRHGLVHRDLKTANIMVGRMPHGDEHVWVLDFGVAKWDGGEGDSITQTGSTVGTPAYMSPEQAAGEAIDHRADLYSLGCLLHEAVTGRPPFVGKHSVKVMYQQLNDPPPPLPQRLTDGKPPSEALRDLHAALLSKDPEQRPENAEEVVQAFADLYDFAEASGAVAVDGPSAAAFVDPNVVPTNSDGLAPTIVRDPLTRDTPSRRPWWPWLALLLAFLGTGAVALALSPIWRPEVGAEKASLPSPPPEPVPTDADPALDKVHHLSIYTRPIGAEVFKNDERVGQTPLVLDMSASAPGPVSLEFRLRGYERYQIQQAPLTGDKELHVTMVKLSPVPSPPKSSPKPAPPPPDDLWER